MKAYERLLQYVAVPTQSNDETGTTPSTAEQWVLARALVEELHALGLSDAVVDDKCYVYATIQIGRAHV